MASKTTLNAKNLEELGAERLSALVMDLVQGNAALKRHARAAVLELAGGDALAAETRKRLARIKTSKAKVSWRKRGDLLDDLSRQAEIITQKIARRDAATALELIWHLLSLARPVFARVRGQTEPLETFFADLCAQIGPIAVAAKAEPDALAASVAAAMMADSGLGETDGLIAALAEPLGPQGLDALKARFMAAKGARNTRAAARALARIADAEGDVDAFVALHDSEVQKLPRAAAEIAARLLNAGRAAEALTVLDAADLRRGVVPTNWTELRLAALEAVGEREAAQALRREQFDATLNPDLLRAYLKRLPDFDDVEEEDRALDHVMQHAPVHRALDFLIAWPDTARAARLVIDRRTALDGNLHGLLGSAADALETRYPLAATVLRRAIIEDTLAGSKSKRYPMAVTQFLECVSAAQVIENFAPVETHDAFAGRLALRHARKSAFWDLLAES